MRQSSNTADDNQLLLLSDSSYALLCDLFLLRDDTVYIKWTYTYFQCQMSHGVLQWRCAAGLLVCWAICVLFFLSVFLSFFSLKQRVTFHWMSPGIMSDLWSRKADLTPRRNALCHHNNQFQIGVPLTIGCYGNSPVIRLFSIPFFQKSLSCVMFSWILFNKIIFKGGFWHDDLFPSLSLLKPT